MKRATAFSLIFLACSAAGSDYCKLNEGPAEKKIRINGVPGFFFKVHPDSNFLSYIETEHNTLLDLNTGKQHPLAGGIDPVWSPDGKFMTHPGEEEDEGIQFYHAKEILQATLTGKKDGAKKYNSALGGVYQSIGLKDGKYSVISDEDGVSIADFEFGANGPKQVGDVRKPCGNIPNLGSDLPMISKDGKFLSIYHATDRSTKIYKLNGNDCDLAMETGFGTGKVSFNSDSSQIAFHIDQFGEFQNGYFSGVSKDKTRNVVVMNIEESSSGKLIPTSWALASFHSKPGDGGYYPDFDKDGNIYYMEDISNNFQFVKVSPKSLEFRPMEDDLSYAKKICVSCTSSGSTTPSSTVILANIWKEACKSSVLPSEELVMGINPSECRNMVEKFYVDSLGVEKEVLMNTCPQKDHQAASIVGQWNPNQGLQAEALIKGKCIVCHTQPRAYDTEEEIQVMRHPADWDNYETIKYKKILPPINLNSMDETLAEQMLGAIQGGTMPKGSPLPDVQKKMITTYLEKKLLDLDSVDEGSDYSTVRRFTDDALEMTKRQTLAQFPDASPELKQQMIITVNCVYAQKNCEEYIEQNRASINEEASRLPAEKRERFKSDKITQLKCQNLYQVNPQQCRDSEKRLNQK